MSGSVALAMLGIAAVLAGGLYFHGWRLGGFYAGEIKMWFGIAIVLSLVGACIAAIVWVL